MAASKKKIEYGFMAAKIAPVDTESTMTKERFLALMDEKYPSSDGWEVWQADSILVSSPYNGITAELPYVTYHLKKVNG